MGDFVVPERAGSDDTAVAPDQPRVPPMPNIGSGERVEGVPHPLLDGISPMIGWQFRPRAKGGPMFMIIRRSGLGSLKVVETFPLTEDGWTSAWRSLIVRNPAAVPKVLDALRDRETDGIRSQSHEVSESPHHPLVTLHKTVFLGGYLPGGELAVRDQYHIEFLEDRIWVVQWRAKMILAELPYTEIEDLEIGGPGVVKTGGGFAGGGFGVAGAIEGMAIASVLNGLTSRTSVKTVLRIQGTAFEIFLLNTKLTPERLRIELSRPLAAIRSARASDLAQGLRDQVPAESLSAVEQLSKLADMLERGLLTREEFELMKANLIQTPGR